MNVIKGYAREIAGGRLIVVGHEDNNKNTLNVYKGRKPKVGQIVDCPCCNKQVKITEFHGIWD